MSDANFLDSDQAVEAPATIVSLTPYCWSSSFTLLVTELTKERLLLANPLKIDVKESLVVAAALF